jgi:hypothetical protein
MLRLGWNGRIDMHIIWKAMAVAIALQVLPGASIAATCSSDQLGVEVDKAGAQLRAFNATNMQSFDAKLRMLQVRRGWDDNEHADRVAALFQTSELTAIDREAFRQYSAIEDLSSGAAGTVDCTLLDALRSRVKDLLTTMERKRVAMSRIIDAELSPASKPAAVVAEAEPPKPAPAKVVLPAKPAAVPSEAVPVKPVTQAAVPPVKVPTPNQAQAQVQVEPEPLPSAWKADAAFDPDQPTPAMPPVTSVSAAGIPSIFTVDEIKAASQGLFGSLSAQLASVIAYSFKQVGSPNGYIMGDEGGGAFLAGLRYGTGKLYLKDGSERRVYWRGPSIGFDVGASGARTLFLVYNLKKADDVFAVMSGVDGAAYVIGGAGMTVLTDGDIVMAPISTGMGLRIGANAGYLRFSAKESWLPF